MQYNSMTERLHTHNWFFTGRCPSCRQCQSRETNRQKNDGPQHMPCYAFALCGKNPYQK